MECVLVRVGNCKKMHGGERGFIFQKLINNNVNYPPLCLFPIMIVIRNNHRSTSASERPPGSSSRGFNYNFLRVVYVLLTEPRSSMTLCVCVCIYVSVCTYPILSYSLTVHISVMQRVNSLVQTLDG